MAPPSVWTAMLWSKARSQIVYLALLIGIWYVFQWRISIKKYQSYHNQTWQWPRQRSHWHSFQVLWRYFARSFNFAVFFIILLGFDIADFCGKYWSDHIWKLENYLFQGYFHNTSKFQEDISPLMMKTRTFDFAMFCYGCQSYWDFTCSSS